MVSLIITNSWRGNHNNRDNVIQGTMKPTFISQIIENCTEKYGRLQTKQFDIQFVVLSLIALILNGLSLFVFCHQKNRSAMRRSLILLSLTESTFHISLIVRIVLIYLQSVHIPKRYWHITLISDLIVVSSLVVDIFVSARNWCNLIITTSRTEAIVFPLKRRKLFNRKRIVIILIVASVIALVLSCCRYVHYQLYICKSPMPLMKKIQFLKNETKFWIENLYYIWKTGIPCFTVIICTFMMIFTLISNGNLSLPSAGVQRRNQYIAIRTALCLAIIFSTFELPSLVITLMKYYDNQVLVNISKTLVTLDSIFNFIVYSLSLPSFRASVIGLFRCQVARNPFLPRISSNNIMNSTNKAKVTGQNIFFQISQTSRSIENSTSNTI